MAGVLVGSEETAVTIVDQVGRSQIEVRIQRAHEGCQKARAHQAKQAWTKIVGHHVRVGRLVVRDAIDLGQQRWVDQYQRSKSDEDPRPRTQRVVRNVVPEGRRACVVLVLTGRITLHRRPATIGVLVQPALDANEDQEGAEAAASPSGGMEPAKRIPVLIGLLGWKQGGQVLVERGEGLARGFHAPECFGSVVGKQQCAKQGQEELEEVGNYDAPET